MPNDAEIHGAKTNQGYFINYCQVGKIYYMEKLYSLWFISASIINYNKTEVIFLQMHF